MRNDTHEESSGQSGPDFADNEVEERKLEHVEADIFVELRIGFPKRNAVEIDEESRPSSTRNETGQKPKEESYGHTEQPDVGSHRFPVTRDRIDDPRDLDAGTAVHGAHSSRDGQIDPDKKRDQDSRDKAHGPLGPQAFPQDA